jgi:hypothetical protein
MRPALSLPLALSMLLVLFAGCAGDKADAPVAAVQTSSLRGVVVTQAIVPIANAVVSVTPGDLSATTGEDGMFDIGPVEPGSYALMVKADGYADLRIEAVAGGELVKAVMVNVRSDVPYIDVISFEGYHECTVDFYVDNVGSQTMPCGIVDCVSGQDVSTDVWLFEFRIESPGLKGILAELVFDSQPTAPAGQMGMHLRSVAETGGCVDAGGGVDVQYASMRGPSPLQMWVYQGIENPGAEDGAAFHVPQNETKLYQIMTVGRADYDAAADVHLMLQSRQQLFITLFYHAIGDPSYTILNAG